MLDQLGDLSLLIDDEDLLKQDELFIKFAQPALDHPLNDPVGFAAGPRLFAQYVALALQRCWRHRGNIEIERVRSRDMHRQLLSKLPQFLSRRRRGKGNKHPDLSDPRAERVVDIGENRPLGRR